MVKAKPLSRKGAVRAADKAFSRFILARDGRCVTCGRVDKLDCSHIIRKARGYFLRWNPYNAAAQCRTCHMEHHNVSEMALICWAQERLGKNRLEEMRAGTHTETHFKTYQIAEIARYFTAKAEELENGK